MKLAVAERRMSLEILSPDDPRWDAAFERLPPERRDVFYTAGFARLCQAWLYREHEVLCATNGSGATPILYPFVRRNLAKVTGQNALRDLFDITSLYGRGGVVTSLARGPELAEFHAELARYGSENRVICAFDRFHPVMVNETAAAADTRVIDVGGFVVVDLRPDLDAIEASFKQSVRKDLRKARRNGIECFDAAGCEHLAAFLEIYYHTMERNAAGAFYYFTEEYFRAMPREIPGQFHYFYSRSQGEVVSCELILLHGKYAHSFLGGTRRNALALGANPLLKWEIIRFLKERGVEYFLLGGGTQPDDGIFNFKKAYAPEGVFPSRVGGTIWDAQRYEGLKHELAAAGGTVRAGRFQFYDAG